MSDNQACCAHVKVVLKHNEHPGGTRSDYWECADGCGARFWPAIVSERLKKDYDCMVYNWRESEKGYNEMDRRRLEAEKELASVVSLANKADEAIQSILADTEQQLAECREKNLWLVNENLKLQKQNSDQA